MNEHEMTTQEWLEADGRGGFASGTVSGIRTRRYHALLLAARTPPTGRMVLVNGFDAWIETKNGKFMLSTQQYAPGVIGGDGRERIESFATDPWPTWRYKFEDGTEIEHELVAAHGAPSVVLTWKLDHAGLGHVSEIADADAPHTPRGCPFQAWSVGELLRLDRRVLAEAKPTRTSRKRTGELATA